MMTRRNRTKWIVLSGLLLACNLARLAEPAATIPAHPTPRPTSADPLLAVPNEYLTGATIVAHDPLVNLRDWSFESSTGSLTSGVFQMQGTAMWHSHLSYKRPFTEGSGLIVRFELLNANGDSELVFVTGDWLTDTFRQFGLYNAARPKADLFQGTRDLGGYAVMGNLTLQAQTWYDLVLAAGHDGRFLAVMWDPGAPSQRAVYDLAAGQNWVGRKWTFYPKATAGETIYVDDLYKISFSGIR